MSTNHTPTTSSNPPFVYQTPSKAFAAGGWVKSSEKPAEKQQNFAGSTDKEAAVAESLLDLHSDVQFLKVASEADPLANAMLETVVTSVHATNPIKKINLKRRQPLSEELCRVVTINKIKPAAISND